MYFIELLVESKNDRRISPVCEAKLVIDLGYNIMLVATLKVQIAHHI